MIKLEHVHIEEIRGIRKLDIDFGRNTFAISGPNGSGKSGVVDAIEFGLTGSIGRLTGRGTKGLSVTEHGPHVDRIKFPDASFVTLQLFIPALGKSATITRKVSSPKKPRIEPPDEDVRRAVSELAEHPEVTLTRREILRFILVEPTKRSEEIQAILKLNEIGETRSALNAAQNKLQGTRNTAAAQVQSCRDALQLHLQVTSLVPEELLAAVNPRRKVLGLTELESVAVDTRLDAGVSGAGKVPTFNKQSALSDLNALTEMLKGAPAAEHAASAIAADLERLESDPALLAALQRHALIEKGLALVDGAECPLCGKPWASEHELREHLEASLAKSEQARTLQQAMLDAAGVVAAEAVRLIGSLAQAQRIADAQGEGTLADLLAVWRVDLQGLKDNLATLDGLMGLKDRLGDGWARTPEAAPKYVSSLVQRVAALPDQGATVDAQTFLATAQVRLSDYRETQRRAKMADAAWGSAKAAYDAYCTVLEEELNALYAAVEADFSAFYRAINEEDEGDFTAKLTASEGKLALDVNFYERGLFPPGAYHSEGHQDSMGVCLYLALMKRLFGEAFTFALLDDVVMSVDADHRYQFCKLLKTQFPNTQFIITTHDRLWAEQLKSAGVVSGKTSIAFHSWTVNTGPLVESTAEIWDEIEGALEKGKVEVAAAALRRHLEYVSRHLADQLGATPRFRADGNYELGDLLPPVVSRLKDVYGKAVAAAHSWQNEALRAPAAERKEKLAAAVTESNMEQWAVNKAVHYNEWANFGKKDFVPVVAAFKGLLACFSCGECQSWLHVSPRVDPESLRCGCNAVNFNLKPKSK